MHVDRPAAGLHLLDHGVVAQAGRHRLDVRIGADQRLDRIEPRFFVLLAVGVGGVGLEQQEPGADRAVAVLEARQHNLVLHLHHLRAGLDQQSVGRGAAPGRVPGPARAFADRPRPVDVRGAPGGDDHRLRPEDMAAAIPDVEADGAGDPVGTRPVQQQVGHHDPVVDLAGGLRRGLGDDRLVALAVDHDLPAAFPQVMAGLRILHDRQSPLLELVHRGIDMAGDVVDQVFAHQPHQVAARVAHVVLRLVLAPLHAHVAVDRRQAVGDGAAALDVRLLDHDDLQVAAPEPRFVGRPAAAEAAADDQHVAVHDDRLPRREERHGRRLPAGPGQRRQRRHLERRRLVRPQPGGHRPRVRRAANPSQQKLGSML